MEGISVSAKRKKQFRAHQMISVVLSEQLIQLYVLLTGKQEVIQLCSFVQAVALQFFREPV